MSKEQATGGERKMQGERAPLLLLPPTPTLTNAVTLTQLAESSNDLCTCNRR